MQKFSITSIPHTVGHSYHRKVGLMSAVVHFTPYSIAVTHVEVGPLIYIKVSSDRRNVGVGCCETVFHYC